MVLIQRTSLCIMHYNVSSSSFICHPHSKTYPYNMHINIGLRFACHYGRVVSTSASHFGDPGFQCVLESLNFIVVCCVCLRYLQAKARFRTLKVFVECPHPTIFPLHQLSYYSSSRERR